MLGLEGGIPLEQLLASLADGVGQQLSQMDVESKGSPIALIITASAGGANDLAKRLPGLNKVCLPSLRRQRHHSKIQKATYA